LTAERICHRVQRARAQILGNRSTSAGGLERPESAPKQSQKSGWLAATASEKEQQQRRLNQIAVVVQIFSG
jgi:hypothetical protein